MEPVLDHIEALMRIRRRRRRCLVFLGITTVSFLLAFWMSERLKGRTAVLPGVVVIVATLGHLVLSLPAQYSKCPHCRRLFFTKGMGSNIFRSNCAHCGLSLKQPFTEDTVNGRLLRLWVEHPLPRPPIPDVGLTCRNCTYALTGLTQERCPECGLVFSIAELIGAARDNPSRGPG